VNGFFAFINNELFGKHSFEYENEFLISIQLDDCPATAEIFDSGLIIIFSEDGSCLASAFIGFNTIRFFCMGYSAKQKIYAVPVNDLQLKMKD